ncbi:MAG: putative zinc-binding metallopeptidase [Prevotella sp.]|nr:putative zinc-binding metallopeptidase [Prevotella sp.]MBQ7441885.1 putative zinc-binding metallopeptidase [Prevotella sp.]MBQ9224258.1 putative zinc-binding metallopeptidase [Prevotella sp.]
MKKYILIIVSLLAMVTIVTSCQEDDKVSSESIFNTKEEPKSAFDEWLYQNFTLPYNIDFRYRYQDSETDNYYNVVPADPVKAQALAILVRELWIGAYEAVFGREFIKTYGPKVYQLLGSPEFNDNGSIVLGYAESGVKITLFRVNELDLDNIYVNTENFYRDHYDLPLDLNYWYFHTMHHEFCHILTQTKNYSTDYQLISAGKYHTGDWINVDDADAPLEGFVTGYASSEYNEDFAEVFSTYVTSTDEMWEQILMNGVEYAEDGETIVSIEGYEKILQKLDIIKDYMRDSWGVNLDDLRQEVLRRTANVHNLDLRTLK